MNITTLTTNASITAIEACKAAHEAADNLFDRLSGETMYVDGTGPVSYPDFQKTVDDALLVELLRCEPDNFEDGDLLADQTVAVNVERQADGSFLYEIVIVVLGSDYGSVCNVKDLATLHDWFDEEWMSEAA